MFLCILVFTDALKVCVGTSFGYAATIVVTIVRVFQCITVITTDYDEAILSVLLFFKVILFLSVVIKSLRQANCFNYSVRSTPGRAQFTTGWISNGSSGGLAGRSCHRLIIDHVLQRPVSVRIALHFRFVFMLREHKR